MPRPIHLEPPRRSQGSEAWRRAAERGAALLDELEAERGAPRSRTARELAAFCARKRLPGAFAWAALRMAREPGSSSRSASRAAWRLAADLAEARLAAPGSAQGLGAAFEALRSAFGPPPAPLLRACAARGDFGALDALLPLSDLDGRLAQNLVDARPGPGGSPLRPGPGLRGAGWGARVEAASRAGARLARFAPLLDLARDAATLDPSCCAFALGAGARPAAASAPPLATLCHEAARRHAPSSKGWPLLAAIGALRADPGLPPEALCATLLLAAGCSPSERLPGGSSAFGACALAARAQARASGSQRSRSRMARALPLARWMAGQVSGARAAPCTPLGALEAVVRAAAEREALGRVGQPPLPAELPRRL